MYSTFSNMWKNLQYNSDQQYITTAQCVIIVDIHEYKTLVKKLATIDFEIMDLVKRHQEITHLQSKLIKEQQEYWHTIRQEDSMEIYFWKSKIFYVTINWYASQLISTGPTIYKKKQYLIVGNTLVNEILIHNKLVMWKKLEKNCLHLMILMMIYSQMLHLQLNQNYPV